MKTYTFFWLDGSSETGQGQTVADAFRRLGYGGGAIHAIDFYAEGNASKQYTWDPKNKTWSKNE